MPMRHIDRRDSGCGRKEREVTGSVGECYPSEVGELFIDSLESHVLCVQVWEGDVDDKGKRGKMKDGAIGMRRRCRLC